MQCCCLLVAIDLQEKVISANVRKLREQRVAGQAVSVCPVLWGLWWPLLPPAVPPQPGCAPCCRPGASELCLCWGDGSCMARLHCRMVESLNVLGWKEPLGSSIQLFVPAGPPRIDPIIESVV